MNKCKYQNWDCSEDMPCSDCYWRECTYNSKSQFIKIVLFGLFLVVTFVSLLMWWDYQEKQIMSIDYCWDEAGRHYVAPNYKCI